MAEPLTGLHFGTVKASKPVKACIPSQLDMGQVTGGNRTHDLTVRSLKLYHSAIQLDSGVVEFSPLRAEVVGSIPRQDLPSEPPLIG